jgi:signal transduction histidine kinase
MREDGFKQLADPLPEALLLVDAAGVLVAANQAAVALLQPPGTGLASRRLASVLQESESTIADLLRDGVQNRTLVPSPVQVSTREGARVCRCDAALFQTQNDGGDPLVLLRLVPSDNTANPATGIAQRGAAEADLQRQTETLRAADRRKDEFLSMLAHELRNPLAPLHTGVQLLMTGRLQGEDLRRVQEMLQRQLGHLTRLLDDLLDIARLNQGRIDLKKAPVPVREIVQQAAEMGRPFIDARHQSFELGKIADEYVIDADAARMVQVIVNLLTNAAKYTPPEGLIALNCVVQRDHVVIAVSDNGIGIEPDRLPRLFNLLDPADRTPDRSEGGLGIGLTVVRMLVQMHGGTVEAHSHGSNRGSEFRVRLPLYKGGLDHSAEDPAAPPEAVQRRLRVLVVDDNIDAGETLRRVLEHWGHEAKTVTNAAEALAAWEGFRPDAALLDIGLPGVSGYDVARQVRALHGQNVLLIAVTGYGRDVDRVASRAAGIDQHVTKPVDLERLRSLLDGGRPR